MAVSAASVVASAQADEEAVAPASSSAESRPRAPSDGAAIVVRATPSAAAWLDLALVGAARRSGRAWVAGAPLTACEPRALGPRVIGLCDAGTRWRLFMADIAGDVRVSEIGGASTSDGLARAVAVALSSLVEASLVEVPLPSSEAGAPRAEAAASEGRPLEVADGASRRDAPGDATVPAAPTDATLLDATGLDASPSSGAAAGEASLRFFFELRGRVDVSTVRGGAHGVAGLGAGGCLPLPWCLSFDLDVLVPEDDRPLRTLTLSYVATRLAAVVRFVPALLAGRVRLGVAVGPVLRVADVWIDGRAPHLTTTSAGLRVAGELGVRLVDDLALTLAVGADVAFDPTTFVRAGDPVLVEDVLTPWGALGLRWTPP